MISEQTIKLPKQKEPIIFEFSLLQQKSLFLHLYRFGDENETMKDEEFHDTTENIIEFGHEENVIHKRKRKPSVKIEMPQTEKSILEGMTMQF